MRGRTRIQGNSKMNIEELSVSGYRNLKKDTLNFSPGINFIYGENAQGKTNLIEAVWMFTGARSFRGTKDIDLVNFNETSAKLEGKFFFEKRQQEISVFFSRGKRKVFLNGVSKPYPTNIIGKFRVVVFSPVQLSLISGGPDGRRKFLDAAICQLKPTYTALLIRYNQTLKQRNALLRNMVSESNTTGFFEVWDDKLSELGAFVVKERLKYLEFLKKEAFKIYFEISGGKENLGLNYISSFSKTISSGDSVSDIKKALKTRFEKSRQSDMKMGSTLIGPHKDELEIFIDDKRVRHFGSQGQQRSAALSLKLAEAAVLEQEIGEPPVILLDDVMSELDDYRKSYMIDKINNRQVFITSCDFLVAERFEKGKFFKVESGKVTEVSDF